MSGEIVILRGPEQRGHGVSLVQDYTWPWCQHLVGLREHGISILQDYADTVLAWNRTTRTRDKRGTRQRVQGIVVERPQEPFSYHFSLSCWEYYCTLTCIYIIYTFIHSGTIVCILYCIILYYITYV